MTEDELLAFLPPELPGAYSHAAEQAADFVIAKVTNFVSERRETEPQFKLPELPFGFYFGLGAVCLLENWEAKGLRPFLSPDLPTAARASAALLGLLSSEPASLLEFAIFLSTRVTDELWRLSCDSKLQLDADIALGEFDESLVDDKLATLLLEILEGQQANQ